MLSLMTGMPRIFFYDYVISDVHDVLHNEDIHDSRHMRDAFLSVEFAISLTTNIRDVHDAHYISDADDALVVGFVLGILDDFVAVISVMSIR
jgi:hypothetical protein